MSPTSVDLHPTARLVEQSPGLKTQLQHILQTAVTVAESDFGNIQLLDDAGHLKIVTYLGFESWSIDFWQTAAGDGHGACGAALANGGRVIVEDVLTSPVFANPADRETMVKAGIRAVPSTTVRARSGQLLGMFSTHYRAAHGLDAKTLKVLDLLTEHAAQAIERAQAEQALSMIGAEYQAIFRNAPVGIAQMDPVRRTFLKVNPAVCAMLGYTEDELVGRRLEDITYPAD
ncbi:MAG: GAF domain-containing protein, partial [Rubrivivax sp.]